MTDSDWISDLGATPAEMLRVALKLLGSAEQLAQAGADSRSVATMVDQAGRQLRDCAREIRRGGK